MFLLLFIAIFSFPFAFFTLLYRAHGIIILLVGYFGRFVTSTILNQIIFATLFPLLFCGFYFILQSWSFFVVFGISAISQKQQKMTQSIFLAHGQLPGVER